MNRETLLSYRGKRVFNIKKLLMVWITSLGAIVAVHFAFEPYEIAV